MCKSKTNDYSEKLFARLFLHCLCVCVVPILVCLCACIPFFVSCQHVQMDSEHVCKTSISVFAFICAFLNVNVYACVWLKACVAV